MKYIPLLRELFKGRSLLKVETWKNVQMVATLLSGIAFTLLKFFPDLVIDHQVIEGVVMAIAYAGSAVTLYLTPATTDKIGFPSNENNTDSSGGDDDSELFMGNEAGSVHSHPSLQNTGAKGLSGRS